MTGAIAVVAVCLVFLIVAIVVDEIEQFRDHQKKVDELAKRNDPRTKK